MFSRWLELFRITKGTRLGCYEIPSERLPLAWAWILAERAKGEYWDVLGEDQGA